MLPVKVFTRFVWYFICHRNFYRIANHDGHLTRFISLYKISSMFDNEIYNTCYFSTVSSPHLLPKNTPIILTSFSLVYEDEVSKIIPQSSTLFLILIDPIPTSFLKQSLSSLLPTLTNIINLPLFSGTFPDQFKSCSVISILKKYNLDNEDLSNYRLNLSYFFLI